MLLCTSNVTVDCKEKLHAMKVLGELGEVISLPAFSLLFLVWQTHAKLGAC